jgi:predicted RNA polymerase sigma factor
MRYLALLKAAQPSTPPPAELMEAIAKLGCLDEARQAFERAATLTRNERERTLFLDRAAACERGPSAV